MEPELEKLLEENLQSLIDELREGRITEYEMMMKAFVIISDTASEFEALKQESKDLHHFVNSLGE